MQTAQQQANYYAAVRPFSSDLPLVMQTNTHKHHYGFRRDRRHFVRFPERNHAIRKAIAEYSHWQSGIPMLPAPPLYLFIHKVSQDKFVYLPFYRGEPFWNERAFDGVMYADLRTDRTLRAAYLHSRGFGGMFPAALAQYEAHYNAVYQHYLQQQVSE